MKEFAKICGVAAARAFIHGLIALSLMLVVEFSISGHLDAFPLYLGASVLITLTFFGYQFICVRRRRIRQPGTSQTGSN